MSRELEEAYNPTERFLRAVCVRLDVIIEQNNSIVEYLSKRDGVAVENGKVVQATPTRKKRGGTNESS